MEEGEREGGATYSIQATRIHFNLANLVVPDMKEPVDLSSKLANYSWIP